MGNHCFDIIFKESTANNAIDLLPSFCVFATDTEGECLFELTVDDMLQPIEDGQMLRKFDTGNGNTLVYLLPNGGYQYVIRNQCGANCCLLICNKTFSVCACALRGNSTMRSFGLNNALMLIYAFASSFHHTLLLHASCVLHQGIGYPFIAPSGTGKSTHTSLWTKHIDGCELLNDDNPIVRIIDHKTYIYGSPWSGKTPCYRQQKALLGAVTRIERATQNSIEKLSSIQAFASLLPACSSMKWDCAIYNNLCDTITRIVESVPVYTLHCLPNEEAALLSYLTLTRPCPAK